MLNYERVLFFFLRKRSVFYKFCSPLEAIELVEEMWAVRITPDVISYTSAISACVDAKLEGYHTNLDYHT